MRLEFLGDARDAFKWDCLHWLVSRTPCIERLVFVPMWCADEGKGEGRTNPRIYSARPGIDQFVASLREKPRSFERVKQLGRIDGLEPIDIEVYHPDRLFGAGWTRAEYWRDLSRHPRDNALVFLDPDTGMESRSQAGQRHVRYGEVLALSEGMGGHGAVAVYQHRPQGQGWQVLLARISDGLPAQMRMTAIHDGVAALVAFGSATVLSDMAEAAQSYVGSNTKAAVWATTSAADLQTGKTRQK